MNLKKLPAYKFFLVGALLCGLVSFHCGGDAAFPRSKTLYLAGSQWGGPNTFNPLSNMPDFPVGGNYNLMYEPLMAFNSLSGEMEPLLAKSVESSDEKVSVIMDSRAQWSDGEPLTAADVKFTYDLSREYRSAPTRFVLDYISEVKIDTIIDEETEEGFERVSFYINEERNNPLVVMDFLQSVRIIPKHVFEAELAQVDEFRSIQEKKFDENPVISGPYNLHSYSSERIVLERREDYWGNEALFDGRLPQPKFIIHPIYRSNDAFGVALNQGNLDFTSTFIPRIQQRFRHQIATWYDEEPYYLPASIPMLMINNNRHHLADRNVRRAMAFAINYEDIRELAVSGYSPELKAGLVLPFGIEEPYFSEEDIEELGTYYNPEKAKQILADAGYTSEFDDNGNLVEMRGPDGEKLPTLSVTSPAGWTDWESMVRIAVRGMRAVGIDVREGFVDASQYWQVMPVGEFDLLMHTPSTSVTPSKPWSRFNEVMSSRNWSPEGERMNENQGRYNDPSSENYNPAVDSLLNVIPNLTEKEQRVAAYRELNRIFMKDQPTLPMVYRPEQYYTFSTRHWENFPTAENPYAPPQPLTFGIGTRILWELTSAAE
ncbi:ABC transporter substrate-binding protein [Chitinispirillales bacterium ANBcel5]|uniref:ABC transporter substrate-binding protein n=1 Tax=Cellulosispirillum alkaliphilum TaxID=3039283 RepID=UPI002A562898|nr:ABC transporter substrate-binding protein [Chitinispirillales bacterium ANBcel5]